MFRKKSKEKKPVALHTTDLAGMLGCERRSEIERRLRKAEGARKQGHEIGRHMKHGKQAPWYRKSIFAKKNPNEEEEKN